MRINKRHVLVTIGFILLLIGTVWLFGGCSHSQEPETEEESVDQLETQIATEKAKIVTETTATQKITTIEESTEELTTEDIEDYEYEDEDEDEAEENEGDYDYLGSYYITGYGAYCSTCNGGYTSTASGASITPWWTVAMSSNYPFGTIIYIDGLGEFEVQDRGVGDGVVDIAVSECEHQGGNEAYNITGYYDVYVVEWG